MYVNHASDPTSISQRLTKDGKEILAKADAMLDKCGGKCGDCGVIPCLSSLGGGETFDT